MNLIEALKKADGKPVRRKAWLYAFNQVRAGQAWLVTAHSTDGVDGRANECLDIDNLLADDWYVVEPKSRIEEAIEREAKRAVALNDVNGEAACFRVSDAMRRIVNLTLDEAIAAVSPAYGLTTPYEIAQRIKALKVKE